MVTGVSLKEGGGFPVGNINMTTGHIFHKNKRKLKPKAQVLNSLAYKLNIASNLKSSRQP